MYFVETIIVFSCINPCVWGTDYLQLLWEIWSHKSYQVASHPYMLFYAHVTLCPSLNITTACCEIPTIVLMDPILYYRLDLFAMEKCQIKVNMNSTSQCHYSFLFAAQALHRIYLHSSASKIFVSTHQNYFSIKVLKFFKLKWTTLLVKTRE